MSLSQPDERVQTIREGGVTSEHPGARHWESVDRLAAQHRLHLARHHQHNYDRLDTEFANLRASQSWLATQNSEEAAHLLVAYVEVLAQYLRQRSLDGELLRFCDNGLRACDRLRQNPGWLLLLRGETQNVLCLWNEAATTMQAAIDASAEEDPSTHARATLALGRLQLNQGYYERALETLTKAERLLAEQPDYEGLAAVQSEMAAYHLNRRELDRALSLYMEADQLRRRAGATEASDHTLLMLGVVYRQKTNYEQASAYLQQLLERGEAQGSRSTTATAAHHLAWAYLEQGNLAEARRLCGRAIGLYEEISDTRGLSDAYEQLGLIALASGQGIEALQHLERSLEIRRQLGNQHGAASSMRRLAIVHLRMGNLRAAVSNLWRSLATYRRMGVLSHQQFTAILKEVLQWAVARPR